MKPELDEALCKKYPLIFRDRHGDMRSTLMCFGFEVGDGWHDLIDSTCALIYWPYEQARRNYVRLRENEGKPPHKGAEAVTAIDVERARLKMSAAAAEVPVAVQIKEKFGTLRFYVNGGTTKTEAFIEFAEYHSGRICETCGAPGKTRGEGWLTTLCELHAK